MKKKMSTLFLGLASAALLASCGGGETPTSSAPAAGSEPSGETSSSIPSGTINDDVVNGGFETGDLTGWHATGTAFSEGDVTNASSYKDGVSIGKEGTYSFAGGSDSLPSFIGTLTSDPFELGGLGMLTLKMGAMADKETTYIEFFLASDATYGTPLTFKKNGGAGEFTRLANDDYDGIGITSHLIRNVIDLRAYLGENIVVRVTDQARGSNYDDYSFVNLDDIRTVKDTQDMNDLLSEREDQLALLAQEPIDSDPPVVELRNGGFESGADYWLSTSGTAFRNLESLLEDSGGKYWTDRDYFGEGSKFVTTLAAGEEAVGAMRSEKFTVTDAGDGHSYASFLMGAAKTEQCYVAVNDGDTGAELMRQTNVAFSDPALAQGMVRYYFDLSDHIGDTLYFTVVDNAVTGGFAFIQVDDFNVNLSEGEVASEVSSNRAWAETCPDETARQAYVDAYGGGISVPLAGEAPTFETDGEYVYEETRKPGSYDFGTVLRSLKVSDDYTATQEIELEIASVKKDGVDVVHEGTVELSEGTYLVEVLAADAYGQKTAGKARITVDANASIRNQIVNGDFETGDLTGWSLVQGNINLETAVSSAATWWAEQVPYNQGGNYHFDGWSATGDEGATYTLRSSEFQLGGSGQISFKMGGKAARVSVYSASGTLIASYTNVGFNDGGVAYPCVANGSYLATMITYVADLSSHIGETMYIEIADTAVNGWAVAFFDDIVTHYDSWVDYATRKDTVTEVNAMGGGESRQTDIPWREARQ